MDWTSYEADGSVASTGSFQYHTFDTGANGPDDGDGGRTRRVVLAPGNYGCQDLPAVTTNHRGQQAGVPFKDAYVLYLAFVTRPCPSYDANQVAVRAGCAGNLVVWSDEYAAEQIASWGVRHLQQRSFSVLLAKS